MAKNVSRPKATQVSRKRRGLFPLLDRVFNIDKLLGNDRHIAYFGEAIWLTFLLVGYIGYSLNAERFARTQGLLNKQVNDIRANYITQRASQMKALQQSAIAERVKPLGLKENTKPPIKVVVKREEWNDLE